MLIANYITVSGFSNLCPSTDVSGYTSTTISGLIAAASRRLDDLLGYSLPIETITEEKSESHIDADGNLVVFPLKRPIVSVSALSLVKGNDQIDLDVTSSDGGEKFDIPDDYPCPYQIIYPSAELAFTSVSVINSFWAIRGTRFFTLTSYRAGHSPIPDLFERAVSLLVKDFIESGRASAGFSEIKQGGIAVKYAEGESDAEKDVINLIAPYIRKAGYL